MIELRSYAYLWSRTGPIAFSGEIVGYRIPATVNGDDLFIAQFGGRNNRHWRLLTGTRECSTGWTGCYATAEAAYTAFKERQHQWN